MTPLEYVEVLTVEVSLWEARATVNALRVNGNSDDMDWTRYLWALGDQLGFRGIDGVRLPT